MNDQTSNNPLDVISQALKELVENRTANDLVFQDVRYVEFKNKKGNSNVGKGLIFTGDGHTKQFILSNFDNFFSSENINIAKEKHFSIDNIPVLTATDLGSNIVNSNLRKVGRLKGLIVDGSVTIDQYIFYNSAAMRLGLGTEAPNFALSVAEMGIEVGLGTSETGQGVVGTFASTPFNIVTDNTERISIDGVGNILLGNKNSFPINVQVHGKVNIGVNSVDERADLQVRGAIKFAEKVHQYGDNPPQSGNYNRGDVVWNSNPELGKYVGWICVRQGNPGTWLPFGEIKPQIK